MENPNAVLGATGTLLTVLAILLTVWHRELTDGIRRRLPDYPPAADREIREMRRVFVTRAVPLAALSTVATLVFLPDATAVIVEAIAATSAGGHGYDSIKAALVATFAGLAFIAGEALLLAARLGLRLR